MCDKAPRYLTITTELIRWRKVCFFLQNILAILADSNLGLFYFCNFSFLYLIGFSVFLVLASFLIFQRLRQNGSTEIHLKLVVNFAVSCNWDSPKQTENWWHPSHCWLAPMVSKLRLWPLGSWTSTEAWLAVQDLYSQPTIYTLHIRRGYTVKVTLKQSKQSFYRWITYTIDIKRTSDILYFFVCNENLSHPPSFYGRTTPTRSFLFEMWRDNQSNALQKTILDILQLGTSADEIFRARQWSRLTKTKSHYRILVAKSEKSQLSTWSDGCAIIMISCCKSDNNLNISN